MDGGTRDMYRGTNIVTVPPISGQLETMLLARFFSNNGLVHDSIGTLL